MLLHRPHCRCCSLHCPMASWSMYVRWAIHYPLLFLDAACSRLMTEPARRLRDKNPAHYDVDLQQPRTPPLHPAAAVCLGVPQGAESSVDRAHLEDSPVCCDPPSLQSTAFTPKPEAEKARTGPATEHPAARKAFTARLFISSPVSCVCSGFAWGFSG